MLLYSTLDIYAMNEIQLEHFSTNNKFDLKLFMLKGSKKPRKSAFFKYFFLHIRKLRIKYLNFV